MKQPKRIAIFGRPGSGKSRFAHQLSIQTGLPCYHLDKIFFGDNWVERPQSEFVDDQKKWIRKDKWIIDGNSFRTLEMRYAQADLCIYFELPFWLCAYRIFKRLFMRDKAIQDRARNCPEKVSLKLLWYCLTIRKRAVPKILHLQKQYPDVELFEICSDGQKKMILDLLTKRLSKHQL
ncbi:MAG: DNA topology modulation protein [Rickettsiales bacterium]|nr:DNA topology modulation protein [Rickettsiales bacterium]|tara:strand:- start:30912 stop:31445 length:534 start_codon:yes stop_codon:yes gene_type:complete